MSVYVPLFHSQSLIVTKKSQMKVQVKTQVRNITKGLLGASVHITLMLESHLLLTGKKSKLLRHTETIPLLKPNAHTSLLTVLDLAMFLLLSASQKLLILSD